MKHAEGRSALVDYESDFMQRVEADADGQQTRTVLIVIPGGLEHGGGIGRQMSYFLQAYQRSGQKPHYRVIDSRGPWFLGASPLRVIGSVAYFAAALLQLYRESSSSPCVAHVNITGRGSTIRKIILSTLARTLGLRYLLHLHDYDYAEYYRNQGVILKRLIGRMFRRAEAVIVLGRRDLDVLSELLQLSKDRMIVLHNAVPDPVSDFNRRLVRGQPCHLVFLGYLSARKGVPELLRALASPAVKRLRWRATLAGGGPIDEFRRLAQELGIAEQLSFPGWLNEADARELCRSGDALVLPSHAEGLAMSMLEGLSQGLAVITTPVGAHPEVIEPEVSGILVPPGDVAALTDALARVIEDEGLRDRLGKGARERFLEGFDIRRYAARLGELHDGLFATQAGHAKLTERG